jgi:hypothetical protein
MRKCRGRQGPSIDTTHDPPLKWLDNTFKDLSENRRIILKCIKKVNLFGFEIRLQYCLRKLRIAYKALQVAIPLGELI